MTFVLAMFGLVLVPSTIFRSLAAGAILVGIVSVLAALTLLPAVLGPAGRPRRCAQDPVLRPRRRAGGHGEPLLGRDRPRRDAPAGDQPRARRRPAARARAPVLGLQTGSQGRSALPDRFESKQGYVLLNEEFPGQTTDPVEIAVAGDASSPRVRSGIERLADGLARRRSSASPPSR